MRRRTPTELYDFLCLVFAIPPLPAGPWGSDEALAAAIRRPGDTVRRLVDLGLLPRPGATERDFGPDDARIAAVAARLLDLGASDTDLAGFADAIDRRCDDCRDPFCPTPCDTLMALKLLLMRLHTEAAATASGRARQAPVLRRAIGSIDALDDLV